MQRAVIETTIALTPVMMNVACHCCNHFRCLVDRLWRKPKRSNVWNAACGRWRTRLSWSSTTSRRKSASWRTGWAELQPPTRPATRHSGHCRRYSPVTSTGCVPADVILRQLPWRESWTVSCCYSRDRSMRLSWAKTTAAAASDLRGTSRRRSETVCVTLSARSNIALVWTLFSVASLSFYCFVGYLHGELRI